MVLLLLIGDLLSYFWYWILYLRRKSIRMLPDHQISMLIKSKLNLQNSSWKENRKNSLQQYLELLQSKDLAICSKIMIKPNKGKLIEYNKINHLSKVSVKPQLVLNIKTPVKPIPIIEDVFDHSGADIPIVYRLGDDYEGERIEMSNLGIDIGTKTIVVSFKDTKGKMQYVSEINGYWPFERGTPFIENMLNDPNKIRSDGTKRAARYFKEEDTNQLIVLGKDAEEFAYSKNDTLLRPMAEGGISPDDMAITVLTAIIHGLIGMTENQIGKFKEDVKICYCTTANGLNRQNNIAYHERAMDLILKNYQTDVKITYNKIKESHAIVINMSPDGTGIGISWGAGTVTVSYVKYGLEVFSFCWVGAGDWIDTQVAMRHGYDPEMSKFKKKSKETPTTVAKKKTEIDLTPGIEHKDRLSLDIVLHYDVLISQVVEGIIQGFVENESEARIEDGINIYMAGGTSSPKGFNDRVKTKFDERDTPFEIKSVKRHDNPLLCVAEGCFKASEMF